MALKVWLEVLQQAAAASAALLTAALQQAQLSIGRPADGVPGIVLFCEPDAALLQALAALCRQAQVLVIATSSPPLDCLRQRAVMAAGARDVLAWPPHSIDTGQVLARLQRWQAVAQLLASDAVRGTLVGDSQAWSTLLHEVVDMAAFSQASVLITGETGTGKDLLAQLIHRLSACRGELTVLDCTTLSPELAGSELFGHERGAYTGAAGARDGAFALADGGVLFLDEIGELPLGHAGAIAARDTGTQVQAHRRQQLAADRSFAWCAPPTARWKTKWRAAPFGPTCITASPAGAAARRPCANAATISCRWPCISSGNWRARRRPRSIPPCATTCCCATIRAMCASCARPSRASGNAIAAPARSPSARCRPKNARPTPAWPDRQFEAGVKQRPRPGAQAAAHYALRHRSGDPPGARPTNSGNNQRAAARLGVTDRALQLRRKAASCAAIKPLGGGPL